MATSSAWATCPQYFHDTIPAHRYITNFEIVWENKEGEDNELPYLKFEDTFRPDLQIDRKYSIQMYKNNPITKEMFNAYFNIKENDLKDISSDSMIKIQSCEDKTQLRSNYKAELKKKNIDGFTGKIFEGFWEHIENKFKCTGFCSTIYEPDSSMIGYYQAPNTLENAPKQRELIKYIFSDVNKGIPKHRGCMMQIMKWLPKMLISFGSFALFAALVQFGLFILSISLLGASSSDDANKPQSQVYQKQDENRQLNEERK